MNVLKIENKAEKLRDQVGGNIFAFPIEDENPYSKYAVVMFDGIKLKAYPNPMTIEEAADSIRQILEALSSIGRDSDYERNVRFISYDAQINGPNVTMRRMKKEEEKLKSLKRSFDEDFIPNGDGYDITARGLIKTSYWLIVDEKNEKASKFMDRYYKLLEDRKYGKTAAAIKQEVRRMGKNDAELWIDKTFSRYIKDPVEIFNLMSSIN